MTETHIDHAGASPAPHVVSIGSFVVDFSMRVPRLPQRGESLVGSSFYLGPGGKGTNVAVTLARQGIDVSAILRVGDDLFASMALDLFAQEQLDTSHVYRTPGTPTALAFASVEPTGDNAIAVYLGANWLLSPSDLREAHQVFSGAAAVVTQLEVPDETVREAFQLGSEAGARCILNPAPARTLDSSLLSLVDILTPNAGEARMLIGLSPEDESVGVAEIGQHLMEAGISCVIITLGADGCLLCEQGREPRHVAAYRVDTVNTVGAGDAFTGGLTAALSYGSSLPEAVEHAVVTAALSTRVMGSIAGLPSRDELEEHVARYRHT